MTTAARPTFDPAKGKDNKNPTGQTSARDLASHTKLKYRKDEQEGFAELDEDDFKNRLLAAEREHFEKKQAVENTEAAYAHRENTPEQRALLEACEKGEIGEESEDGEVDEASYRRTATFNSDEEDDEDEDDEEDTEALMRELEKIKQERAEAKARQERERQELEKKREEEVLQGNPLLNDPDSQNFTVKRRYHIKAALTNDVSDGMMTLSLKTKLEG
ncbi:complexed with cef1p, variant 2 [Entomophthora muscae]|uniref:Complexed with cef1p, variant 2 n=1 Tax=Entomophthora muscae TaxID=34485 RepID=A0ACC2RWN6_9FUNG|nr:complexed with cef1p, variant 2 [Entomophthora muscae]